jgi:hypothetical protein
MQRREWDAKTKAMIVLEGLRGKPVVELCTEHQDVWVRTPASGFALPSGMRSHHENDPATSYYSTTIAAHMSLPLMERSASRVAIDEGLR